MAAYAVDSPEALDNAHGIPVNIIVHQIVGVLEILSFGNAIRGDEDIDFSAAARH